MIKLNVSLRYFTRSRLASDAKCHFQMYVVDVGVPFESSESDGAKRVFSRRGHRRAILAPILVVQCYVWYRAM